jgi:hypothetical protein
VTVWAVPAFFFLIPDIYMTLCRLLEEYHTVEFIKSLDWHIGGFELITEVNFVKTWYESDVQFYQKPRVMPCIASECYPCTCAQENPVHCGPLQTIAMNYSVVKFSN